MKRLNNKELHTRIDRFMTRKMEQFPELRQINTPEERRTDTPDSRYTIHHQLPGWHLSQITR